jgi:hypothetical protein
VTCAAIQNFDNSKSSIQKRQQYSNKGFLEAKKIAFGHEMGTIWAQNGHGLDVI